MTKKETTSDQLKIVFQYALHSAPDDWRRLSRKKNAQGQIVREFENRKNHAKATVTELAERQFHVEATDADGKPVVTTISIPEQFEAAAKKVGDAEAAADQLDRGAADGNDYNFTLTLDEGLEGLNAIIMPECSDEPEDTKKIKDAVRPLLPPDARYEDDCVMGVWNFPQDKYTPLSLARELLRRGFAWNGAESDKLAKELAPLKAGKPTAKAVSGPALEMDPAMNAAADDVIAYLMGEKTTNDEDEEWGVPSALVQKAGKALANRHCFAVSMEDGALSVMITPIRYFEKEGACSDQTGPIDHLLPKCAELMESTWEFYDPNVKTPLDAAKYLQGLGFVWNRDFQEFIDKSLTVQVENGLSGGSAASAPVAAKTYYTIMSVDEAPTGGYEVLFGLSGTKNDLDRPRSLQDADLGDVLTGGFGRPMIFSMEYKNVFSLAAPTQEEAKQLASELVYVLQKAGLEPMKDEDTRKYPPKAPGASAKKPRPPKV